jgi:RND family efflux transporter MFP subunit
MSKRTLVTVLSAVLLLGAVGVAWISVRHGAVESARETRYHCPMHPTVVSGGPGDCPICGMRLVPIEREAPGVEGAGPAPARPHHCPMHPTMVADGPGDCSICGMRRVPVERAHVVASAAGSPAAAVPGLATVHISSHKQQLIGVKTARVGRSAFRRTIRAVGRVTPDETRLHHVHTKIGGWVEKLWANATGEWVGAGQPLLDLYSPELLATQQEYLVALEARSRTASSTLPSVATAGDELAASARRRLELLDLTEEQLQEIETSGQARRTVSIAAPISGTILARNVTQGERIGPETILLEVADLSRVWVIASVYQHEMPFVRVGQSATMSLSYLPGRAFEGNVGLVYPTLDPATRTVQVRLEFANPGLELKPDMYAEVDLIADLGERLAVPASAVMDTGTRSVAFVALGDGFFDPREVRIGLRLSEAYEVLEGLAEGESVLTSANFFVDSESKLEAALAAMGAPPAPAEPPR